MLKQGTMPSRIPVRIKKPPNIGHNRTVSAPSKLERLAAEFQGKLLREKERKLVAIHQEEASRALELVQNYQNGARNAGARNGYGSAGSIVQYQQQREKPRGILREFFQERHELANDPNGNNYHHSNINYHYKQKRAAYENSPVPSPPSNNGYRGALRGKPPLPLVKNTSGRDKAHPLEPLERRSPKNHQRRHSDSPITNGHVKNHSPKPPPFDSKPHLVRQHRRGSGGYSSGSDKGNSPIPDIYNLPADKALIPISNKPQKVKRGSSNNMNNAPTSSDEDSSTSGPSSRRRSKFQQWQDEMDQKRNERNNREKNFHHVPQPPQVPKKEKLSSFQKWQMEQDLNREERLQRLNQRRNQEPESPAPFSDRDLYSNRTQPSQRNLEPISNRSKARSPSVPRSTKVASPQFKDDTMRNQKDSILKKTKQSPLGKKEIQNMTEEELLMEIERKEAMLDAMRQKTLKEQNAAKRKKAKEAQKEREKQKLKSAKLQEDQRQMQEAEEQGRTQSQTSYTEESFSRQDSYHQDTYGRRSRRRDSYHRSSPETPMITPKPKKQQKKQKPLPPPRTPERQPTPNNDNTAFYLEMATADDAVGNVDLAECPTCGRNFASDRLARHTKICKKAASKKPRKVFDPVTMRTQGTDQAKYAREAEKAKRQKKAPKSNWRAQHDSFVKSIRYAKKVSEVEAKGGDVSELPPPPVTENPDYKECPYCSRRFNPLTAERHIPKCKDIKSRPAPPKQRRR